ncbi:MAG: 6-phosphofructokinase, partial [Pseudomonadota bacterium]|nr:6-phosphofructokinase [Pseudomonadota bacterium]
MNEISEIRRIGVLTSGEDCAVLNAAIRAVVYRVSFGYGWDVVGIEIGTLGLLSWPITARPLGPSDLDGRLNRENGTFLGSTNKGNPFASKMPDGSVRNRFMAAVFGSRAFNLLAEGQRYRMAAWRNRQVIDVPISDAIANNCGVDVDVAFVATA